MRICFIRLDLIFHTFFPSIFAAGNSGPANSVIVRNRSKTGFCIEKQNIDYKISKKKAEIFIITVLLVLPGDNNI